MKTLFAQILLCAALLHGTCLPIQAATVVPQDLRCEYLSDPLGIDTPQPRLSWRSGSFRGGRPRPATDGLSNPGGGQ